MADAIVQECRGIILDEAQDWKVLGRAFDKFFNFGEPGAAPIDWPTARVQEKVDGSLCMVYHNSHEWDVATTGNPNANGRVNDASFTFADLFWETFQRYSSDQTTAVTQWDQDLCYLFELTSPHNRVVVRQSEAKLTFLAVRHRASGAYLDLNGFSVGPPPVREYPLTSFTELAATFDALDPLVQEGYVVVDSQGRRIKVKHPGYVALHQMRTAVSPKSLLEVARKGETAEVITYFPELEERLQHYAQMCDDFAQRVHEAYADLAHIGPRDQREFAERALKTPFAWALFGIRAGKWRDGR